MTMLAIVGWGCFGSILLTMYGQYLWKMATQDALYTDATYILHQFGGFDEHTIMRYKGL